MNNWIVSKESKKITFLIVIVSLILLIQITGFGSFDNKLYSMSLNYTMKQVEELSFYVEKQLQLELEKYTHLLKITSLVIDEENPIFSPKVLEKIEQAQPILKTNILGIADINGNSIDIKGEKSIIKQKNIKETIEKDQVYISNIIKKGDNPIIYIAVPLKKKGKIWGYFWGKFLLYDIVNEIIVSDNNDKYFLIIDNKGHYVLSSKNEFALNKLDFFYNKIIWNELEAFSFSKDMTVQKVHEMVNKGESGTFYFEGDGQGRYVSFRPLKIHDWYLFSVQVEDGLSHFVHHIRQLVILFLAILVIGLLVIFCSIYILIHNMYKKLAIQHDEIQVINAVFQVILHETKDIPFVINYEADQVVFYRITEHSTSQLYSFADIKPEIMLEKGFIGAESYNEFKKLYKNLVVQQKKCDPTILYMQIGKRKEWVRISIISEMQDNSLRMIGVLENYGEQKEKDLKIENHRDNIKRIEKKSQLDFLTKLYNRETFIKKVHGALELSLIIQNVGALIIIDLDHFKEVNDTMGHGMGDIVLQEIANELLNFFRKGDIVARLGGDEFIVFIHNISDIVAFEHRIQNLNQLLCKTYQKDEKNVTITASIGIALTNTDIRNFNDLYEKADKVLYEVKHSTKNGYKFYSKEVE